MNPARPRAPRRLTALVLLPLLLLLGGCFRMDLGIQINADDTADITMEVGDLTGMMTADDLDCTDLESELADAPEDVEFTVEQTEEDGNIGCRLVASGAPLDEMSGEGMSITREDDLFVFSFDGDDTAGDVGEMPAGMEPEISIAVTFPGPVVDDGGGEVDGNTVTWTGMEALSGGVTASGEAEGSGASAAAGSPVLWIVLAVVLLLVIAAVIFFLTRRKKSAGTEGPEGYTPGVPGAYAAGYANQGYPAPDGSAGGYPAPGGSAGSYPAPQGGAPQGYAPQGSAPQGYPAPAPQHTADEQAGMDAHPAQGGPASPPPASQFPPPPVPTAEFPPPPAAGSPVPPPPAPGSQFPPPAGGSTLGEEPRTDGR
ncbi:LppM family (lipo)protein [Georgenia faecalis]|uniref:LppM family (Lipo)protein n=1 Tax=Georgenia faecalis TaxID=2483799 RepID=A0ABV9D732_9MICO|nr:hypothetical protein [Georgenia faecalis]